MHIKSCQKSAEKESGPGQSCMTNPSLTPSVPLSTSKDKSCIEYKHWILLCDNAKFLCWIHYKNIKISKKPSSWLAETGRSIIGCTYGRKTENAMWRHIPHTPHARWPLEVLSEHTEYRFWHLTCADLYWWSFFFFFFDKGQQYLTGLQNGGSCL